MSQITNLSSGSPTPGTNNTFHAYPSADIPGVTGSGTLYTVVFDSISWNIGDEYDPDTGIWTPEVGAYYQVNYGIGINGITVDNDVYNIYFESTGLSSWNTYNIYNPYTVGAEENLRVTNSFLMKIDGATTFKILIEVFGSVTDNIGLISTGPNVTYFSAIKLQ